MPVSGDDIPLQKYFGLKDNGIQGILWSPIVLGLTVVVYALSRTANSLLFSYAIAAASVVSVLYFSRTHPPQQVFTQNNYSAASLWDDAEAIKDYPSTELDLFYPPLTKSVDQLLGYFYRDFVHSWWNSLQSSYDEDFEKTVKGRLNSAVTNVEKTLLKQERNDIVMAIMYGLANTLIIHMRECRTYETSGISMDDYVVENPHSPFAQLLSKKEQHQQLRGLSNTILKRILPPADMNSRVVNIMLKELLATHLFGNILASCSDPDFINGWIVEYLSDPSNKSSDVVDSDSTYMEPDGLRSLVEKATEDAMAAEQQQQQQQHQHQEPQQHNQQNYPSDYTHHQHELESNSDDSSSIRTDNNTTTRMANGKEDVSFLSQQLPPTTPEPVRTPSTQINDMPSTLDPSSPLTAERQMTLSKADQVMLQSPMIYAYGTVSFSIMDISPPQDSPNMDKSSLMYIIQIERPALQESSGSEGGGYVITRTYNDFDVFQTLMRTKHGKRVARLNLRLPLDVTRSWLRKKRPTISGGSGPASSTANNNGGGGGGTASNRNSGEAISHGLEHYLNTVVGDAELGRDPLILAFLRKERATQHGTTQTELSFADEYKDELVSPAGIPLAVDTSNSTSMGSRAMSLFGRRPSVSSGNTPTPTTATSSLELSNGSSPRDESTATTTSTATDDFTGSATKSDMHDKTARQESISSDSRTSLNDSEDDRDHTIVDHIPSSQQKQQPLSTLPSEKATTVLDSAQQKPLSAMDTELLIETTFALIVEIFDLTTANNKAWMRRSLLNVLREIVRRSYTELVAKQYNHYMQAYLSPKALVGWMELIKSKFWPGGLYNTSSNSSSKKRTVEEKRQTEQLAKHLLVQRAIPGGVRQLIGDQNSTLAMERIWARLQDEDLNRVLVLQVLERVVRPLFG
ncbi:unnamed protein product [Absidia cylindrospora]